MPPRSPFARPLLLICALLVCLSTAQGVVLQTAGGAPAAPPERAGTAGVTSAMNRPTVSLESTALAVPGDGEFDFTGSVSVAQAAPYLQARLRIYTPRGRMLYQKTHVRNDLPAGRYDFRFTRQLSDLELDPGVYPVEFSVVSEGNPPDSWMATGALRIYDSEMTPLQIVPVVRISSAPSVDPEGNFVVDPGVETEARDEAVTLAEAVLDQPKLRASIAIAPELLEEWKRITTGYTYAGPAGIERVEADSEVPQDYASALGALKAALATTRLELLDTPYADPDVAGLASIRRERDLGEHFDLGGPAYSFALGQPPAAGTFTARGCLTAAGARVADEHGIDFAIVSPRYVRSAEGSAAPGVWSTSKVPLTLLASDPGLGALFGSTATTAVAEALFVRALAGEAGQNGALAAIIEVGPGRTRSAARFAQQVEALSGEPWVSFVTAGSAARNPTQRNSYSLAAHAGVLRSTPSGWWSSIAASRRYAEALKAVLPPDDEDGTTAVKNSLVAQSVAWAGPDGTWALADRGRAYSSAAVRSAQEVFETVEVRASDITLSGARGEVPFSVTNGSPRILNVVLRVTAQDVALRAKPLKPMTLLPAENYVTVPVDLRASTGGKLRLQVVAGTLVIASTVVDVRASYLDRLAIVGAIALVLGVMLLYIRRRVRRAERSAGPE